MVAHSAASASGCMATMSARSMRRRARVDSSAAHFLQTATFQKAFFKKKNLLKTSIETWASRERPPASDGPFTSRSRIGVPSMAHVPITLVYRGRSHTVATPCTSVDELVEHARGAFGLDPDDEIPVGAMLSFCGR
jgi:hypothetical protein